MSLEVGGHVPIGDVHEETRAFPSRMSPREPAEIPEQIACSLRPPAVGPRSVPRTARGECRWYLNSTARMC